MSSRNENTTHISMGYRNAYYVYWWRKIITLSIWLKSRQGGITNERLWNLWKVKLNGIVPGRLIRHTRADSAIIKSHWHPELEINTVFEGSSRFFINGRIEDVTPSHVVVINSREVHSSIPFFPQGGICVTGVTIQISYDFLKKWFQIMITVTLFLTIWQNGRYSYFLKKWIRNVKHKMQHIWIFMQSNKFVKLCIFLQQNVVWNRKSSKRQVRKVFSVLNMFLIMFMKTTAAISRPVK